MNDMWMYIGAGAALVLALMVWLVTQIHYRIGSKHLKILLFGIPLRKVPLEEIVYVSKREPEGMAERWFNTFKSSHTLVTIERSRGFRKYICITPRSRYTFMADLKRAVLRVNPQAEWAQARQFEEVTEDYRKDITPRRKAAGSPPLADKG